MAKNIIHNLKVQHCFRGANQNENKLRAISRILAELPHESFGRLCAEKIYFCMLRRGISGRGDRRIEMIPIEDALQEITTTLLSIGGQCDKDGTVWVEWSKENFSAGANAVRNLCSAYGYGSYTKKEISLDAEIAEDFTLYDVLASKRKEPIEIIDKVLDMYETGKTVKEICEKLGVLYTHSKQTAFNRLFPKNIGKGGIRKNAGKKNRSGIQYEYYYCPSCGRINSKGRTCRRCGYKPKEKPLCSD